MKDLVGQQFGNYHLTHLLGRGGFAEVYLGQHVRLKMQAAIKVLHTHLADEDIEEFQREAQVVATLVHPNIVRILDFDVRESTISGHGLRASWDTPPKIFSRDTRTFA